MKVSLLFLLALLVQDAFAPRLPAKETTPSPSIAQAIQSAGRRQENSLDGPGPEPARAADGSYPLLLQSIKQGQVHEIKTQKIKKWGPANREKIAGKDYWVIILTYSTDTQFGEFDVEAKALVRKGKVEKWIYASSEEVVP